MQAPRLPSIFKSVRNKRFNFSTRYYDERKERLKELKEGKSADIKFKSTRPSSKINKGRNLRLFIVVALLLIVYLILKN